MCDSMRFEGPKLAPPLVDAMIYVVRVSQWKHRDMHTTCAITILIG